MIPSVSQKRKRSPPSERVISISSTRKFMSARLASSPPTDTYRSCCLAKPRATLSCSLTASRLFFSLWAIIWSETESDISTACIPHSILALISGTSARFQVIKRAFSPSSTKARMPARSSSPMAGMPHSISPTPMESSMRAMAIFSRFEKTTPAVCSPSRRVVSSMIMLYSFMSDSFLRINYFASGNAQADSPIVTSWPIRPIASARHCLQWANWPMIPSLALLNFASTFFAGRLDMGEIGLRDDRHDVHDKRAQLLDLLGDQRHLVVVDARHQHRIDLDGHAPVHRRCFEPFKLVGDQDFGRLQRRCNVCRDR